MNRRQFVKQSSLAVSAMFCGSWRVQKPMPTDTGGEDELNRVATACHRLRPLGWGALMAEHGLNLGAANLRAELLRALRIKRHLPGFEDFSPAGTRAIEPGVPSSSLLLHAFASPNVIGTNTIQLMDYPTLAEIDAVENLVFGIQPPSWSDLKNSQGNTEIAIAVFAAEYRPASKTPHGRHADLCFSRTGVARVGTDEYLYDGAARCFTPVVSGKLERLRVLPSRFSVCFAVKVSGTSPKCSILDPLAGQMGDSRRQFWIPIHKIFSGASCLAGETLEVTLDCEHVNSKLRNVHELLKSLNIDTGWDEPQISQPPFKFTSGIARLHKDPQLGSGVVVPIPHHPLIARALLHEKLISFPVSQNLTDDFRVQISLNGNPANTLFVDATLLEKDGQTVDVSRMERKEIKQLHESGFRAVHFIDYTGEGGVTASIHGLAANPKVLPAASLVSAPDFLPYLDPSDLSRWTRALALNPPIQIWKYDPIPLSDQRALSPPALQASDPTEDTVTAVRSSAPRSPERLLSQGYRRRTSFMSDAASGLFSAGWDWGNNDGEGRSRFFTDQWSSSPFAVDMALCGAQSYWPGTVPDFARWFAPFKTNLNSVTDIPTFSIAPLTDDEFGVMHNDTWDGTIAPTVIRRSGAEYVQYVPSYRASYAQAIEKGRIEFLRFAQLGEVDYQDRILAMTRVYRCLGLGNDQLSRAKVAVLSFQVVGSDNSELKDAFSVTKLELPGQCFRFDLCTLSADNDFVDGDAPGTVAKRIGKRSLFFTQTRVPVAALPAPLLQRDSAGNWTVRRG